MAAGQPSGNRSLNRRSAGRLYQGGDRFGEGKQQMPQVTGSAPPRDAERPLPRRWRRRVFARIVLPVPVLVVALVGALTVWLLRSGDDDAWEPTSAEQLQAAEDALHRRVVAELRVFGNWLEENDAEGYVGEIGIPNDEDADRW